MAALEDLKDCGDQARGWLLLAAGDDRQHGCNDGYADDIPRSYLWDSTVPHHADLQAGHPIAIRDKRVLLGVSVIDEIEVWEGRKKLYRCPSCGLANIKARTTMNPRYRCYRCFAEFGRPTEIDREVQVYRSSHALRWVGLAGALTAATLRSLCVSPRSQQSMRPLHWDRLISQLETRLSTE